MSNTSNPANYIYEALIEQCLHSILDISRDRHCESMSKRKVLPPQKKKKHTNRQTNKQTTTTQHTDPAGYVQQLSVSKKIIHVHSLVHLRPIECCCVKNLLII